jgi:hypothetical protein
MKNTRPFCKFHLITGLKFTVTRSCEFHWTYWTQIHRNTFLQNSFDKLDWNLQECIPANFIRLTGLKFAGTRSCKFHLTNWTEIRRSTFLQIYINHVINLTMLLKNTEMHSYKFSQPCERKTHEGIPSKFLWSWWFSPCAVVLLGPSLHGPTSISLLPL